MPSATQERNEAKEYYELSREGEQPLYEGCRRYSRLSFLVKLYHIKCLCGLCEKSMTMILELIKDAFEYANIPSSFYEAKKSIIKLGLNYVKISACPNGCMLYWGKDEERETCKNCNTSKWKTNEDVSVNKKYKKIPAKVLRYFPLKPRLQRLFLSSKKTEDMIWHATDTNNDGMLRHPRDSEAWKKFYLTHTWFSSDPQSLPMFKCEWANTTSPRGIKIDKLGFTSINFARLLHNGEREDNEPYIQASEAQMVFYVDDESEQGWSIHVHLKPRDLYDMGGNDEIITPIEPYPSQNLEQIFSNDDLGTLSANDDNN
ncbi:unnamed protein product [Vicia faba]|uniref:DUF4216 domain-containing protein n=1 Tax=Vicia faba TaxID=3906 RepID=A0AAV0YSZ0_VICFA|nr:unnamed protein product [Vicia faba]